MVPIEDWQVKYWHAKHVYGNWFAIGQFASNKLEDIVNAGFKTLLNVRALPSTVALLNVHDSFEGTVISVCISFLCVLVP